MLVRWHTNMLRLRQWRPDPPGSCEHNQQLVFTLQHLIDILQQKVNKTVPALDQQKVICSPESNTSLP